MGSARRPAHLLIGAHSAMEQPLQRALRGRRRYRFLAVPRRRIIDDQCGLPGHVCLQTMKHSSHLARSGGCLRRRCGGGIEGRQGIAHEVECPPNLAPPPHPPHVLPPIPATPPLPPSLPPPSPPPAT